MTKIVRYQCHMNPDVLCSYEMACAPCEYFEQNINKLQKVTLKKKTTAKKYPLKKSQEAWRCTCGLPNTASVDLCSCGKKRPFPPLTERIIIRYRSKTGISVRMFCPHNRLLNGWNIMVGSIACRECESYRGHNQHGVICGPKNKPKKS